MKEKLRQLYPDSISVAGLLNAVTKGWVTITDVIEIVGAENALDTMRKAKLAEISEACNRTIVNGIDVKLDSDNLHFNLSIEDQSNINNLFRVVELGGTEFPYQSDGGKCRVYKAAEIVQIYIAAQTLITTQTTYHNALKSYVQSLGDVESIVAVSYGDELAEPYKTEMEQKMKVAADQMAAIVKKLGGG